MVPPGGSAFPSNGLMRVSTGTTTSCSVSKCWQRQATSTTHDAVKRFRYSTPNVYQMEAIRPRKNTIV